ncbi:MAG: enoyl-CoA hydratase [Burkholderiales bacterium]|nr:enoyl-CoA hydratase [Burkholderiales bacterium]
MVALAHENPEAAPALTSRADGILSITLNRPKRGNALSVALIAALQSLFEDAARDRTLRVIVLAATGRIFCAGNDLQESRENSSNPEFVEGRAALISRLAQTMMALPQPIIAKVDGVATAAGCQLVAASDLAVASTNARFGTPGVNIGTWCAMPMVALSRVVHRKHAMQFLLTGELHDAATAQRMGLVNEVVAPHELDAAVDRLASLIASKSPYTVALGKRAFYQQIELGIPHAYEYAKELSVRNSTARDAREGVAAFLEKREPRWEPR